MVVYNLITCDSEDIDHIYTHSGLSSTVTGSFSSPGGVPRGMIVNNSNLISTDLINRHIYFHTEIILY